MKQTVKKSPDREAEVGEGGGGLGRLCTLHLELCLMTLEKNVLLNTCMDQI